MPEISPQAQQSKISNFEWGMVFGAMILVDLGQYGLDAFIIGPFANPLIDVFIGLILPFYFRMRGIKPTAKKVLTWVGIPLIELLSAGILSFWTIDVLLTFLFEKAEEKLLKNPVTGGIVGKMESLEKNHVKKPGGTA